MITTATNHMIPELKKLWKLSFHDDNDYIDFYYENRFCDKETIVYLIENQIVAMLTLMPGYVVHQNTKLPVSYVYAVATHPEHRSKGYAKALLEYANLHFSKDNVGTFLVPATPSLFPYYEMLGYQLVSNKKLLHTDVDTYLQSVEKQVLATHIKMEQLTVQEYYQYRACAYKEAGYVMWDERALDYLIREFQFVGGYASKVVIDQEEGAVLYYVNKDTLIIKETTLSDRHIFTVVNYLKEQMNFSNITIHLPKTSLLPGESIPYVMSYGGGFIGGEYVNLVLD